MQWYAFKPMSMPPATEGTTGASTTNNLVTPGVDMEQPTRELSTPSPTTQVYDTNIHRSSSTKPRTMSFATPLTERILERIPIAMTLVLNLFVC